MEAVCGVLASALSCGLAALFGKTVLALLLDWAGRAARG